MQSNALVPSISETSATYQAILKAECCLAQKTLGLVERFHCGTDSPEEWQELGAMRAALTAVRMSLDPVGGYWQSTLAFSGNILGCQLQVFLQDYGLGTITLVEGDTPGVVDIDKSVAQYAAYLRDILGNTLFVNGGHLPWDGDWPMVSVCADGNSLLVQLHPYLVLFAPEGVGMTGDVGDWAFTFGSTSTCSVPIDPPPSEGWLPASGTATELVGGEYPLGIQSCCVPARTIKTLFAQVQAYCQGCDAQNVVPAVYYDVTGSTAGCCGCEEGDVPELQGIFIR